MTRFPRRRRLMPLLGWICGMAAVILGVAPAWAQKPAHGRAYRSPQNWALELRGGPYLPNVDNEFLHLPADERPYAQYFGNRRRLLLQAELDYQFFQGFGSLAVGLSAGYTRQRARAFVEPPPGTPATERSGDSTALTLYPTAVSLVYRFDVLARWFQIPLVPYAKAGLDYVFWSVTDGDGNVSDFGGTGRGRGGTPGWHVAGGVAFLLDIFDPGAAQELDSEIGVNATYIFAELAHYDISGLGRSNVMQLGDTTWQVGLLFEF